MSLLTL